MEISLSSASSPGACHDRASDQQRRAGAGSAQDGASLRCDLVIRRHFRQYAWGTLPVREGGPVHRDPEHFCKPDRLGYQAIS